MLTADRAAGGALVGVALVVLWESRRLPLGSLRNPGPAYLPVVLGTLLLLFGVLLMAASARGTPLAASGWLEWRHVLAILAACVFAAVALERFGYRITILALLVFLLRVVERRGIVFSLAVALGLAAGSFFLFDTLLRVPLPRGPLAL